jgi:hypothetical protein
VKVGANHGVGEVSLHGIFLLLCFALDGVELDSLSLYISETSILGVQGVDVGDNTRVPKVEQCVVHHKLVVRGWVEDTKVGIS